MSGSVGGNMVGGSNIYLVEFHIDFCLFAIISKVLRIFDVLFSFGFFMNSI